MFGTSSTQFSDAINFMTNKQQPGAGHDQFPGRRNQTQATAEVAKVLQSHMYIAALLFNVAAGSYVLYEIELPTWLQHIDKTNCECFWQAMDHLWVQNCVDFYMSLFPYVIELCCLDSAGSNKKYIRHRAAAPPRTAKDFNVHAFWCTTHKKHTVAGCQYCRSFKTAWSHNKRGVYVLFSWNLHDCLSRHGAD